MAEKIKLLANHTNKSRAVEDREREIQFSRSNILFKPLSRAQTKYCFGYDLNFMKFATTIVTKVFFTNNPKFFLKLDFWLSNNFCRN